MKKIKVIDRSVGILYAVHNGRLFPTASLITVKVKAKIK